VTIGFRDFKAADVISTGLPDGVDPVSVVPGVELEFTAGEHWRFLPYVQAGARSQAGKSNTASFRCSMRISIRRQGR